MITINDNLKKLVEGMNSLFEEINKYMKSTNSIENYIGMELCKSFSSIFQNQLKNCINNSTICDFQDNNFSNLEDEEEFEGSL